MRIEYFNFKKILSPHESTSVATFLYEELGRYGDPQELIMKAIDYAMDDPAIRGGLVAVMYEEEKIIGAVVINYTGMEDYIPENILVYIAVHHTYRHRGLGKILLSGVLEQIKGDVALHVEPQNPAIHLYRTLGFNNKYIEMRLLRKGN